MVAETLTIDYRTESEEEFRMRGYAAASKVHDLIFDKVASGEYDTWPTTQHGWCEAVILAFDELNLTESDILGVNAFAISINPNAARSNFVNNLADVVYTLFITRFAQEVVSVRRVEERQFRSF